MSPEQIAGRAKRDKEPFSITFPTIFRAIDTGVSPPQLKKIMRFKWKHKKCKTEDKRGKIPNITPISERPAGAENRTRFEHLESDTVLGMRKTGCFGTHVERKSGYLVAFRIDDRQDNAFNKATIEAFSAIPDKLKKSFTVDNGKEFAAHQEPAEATGMKGSSFADISDDLQLIVDMINNRPRKRLNFLTPFEVLKKFFP